MPAGTLLSKRPIIRIRTLVNSRKLLFIDVGLLAHPWQSQGQQQTQTQQQTQIQQQPSVLLEGSAATHGQQLQVTPTRGLRNNKPFEIAILIPSVDPSKPATECKSLSLIAMENNG